MSPKRSTETISFQRSPILYRKLRVATFQHYGHVISLPSFKLYWRSSLWVRRQLFKIRIFTIEVATGSASSIVKLARYQEFLSPNFFTEKPAVETFGHSDIELRLCSLIRSYDQLTCPRLLLNLVLVSSSNERRVYSIQIVFYWKSWNALAPGEMRTPHFFCILSLASISFPTLPSFSEITSYELDLVIRVSLNNLWKSFFYWWKALVIMELQVPCHSRKSQRHRANKPNRNPVGTPESEDGFLGSGFGFPGPTEIKWFSVDDGSQTIATPPTKITVTIFSSHYNNGISKSVPKVKIALLSA